MGPWVRYSLQAIQSAFQQLGYPSNSDICFITFDSTTELVKIGNNYASLADLVGKLDHITSRGSTCMSGVMPLVLEHLLLPHQSFFIVVVSDGEIDMHDRNPSIQAAQLASTKLGVSQVPIDGVLLRTKTSSSASPDTRALASIGSFCTEKVAITDVNCFGYSEEIGLLNLTQAIVDGMKGCFGSAVVETDGSALLRRLPTDAPVASLRIVGGRSTYLLLDKKIESICINGNSITVVDETPADNHISEETLKPFIEFVLQQVQMWTVVGSRDADIKRIRSWFQELKDYFVSIAIDAVEEGDLSLMARTRTIVREINKRQGSIIDRLLQLENKEVVAKLNSQQKANWLNNIKADKGGRALAKRAQKAQDGEIDYVSQAQTAIRQLAASGISEEPPNKTVSFYSMADNRQSTIVAARELVLAIDEISATDVLPCVGLNGVPFEAHPGNYVDPYSMRINRGNIFFGQTLGEYDLWVRRIQGGSSDFACPGRPRSNITGVIALREIDPETYDLMTSKDVRPLFEMQCSVQIRGALAVVPQDAIALNAAAIWNILDTFAENGNLSTLERSALGSFVGNLHHLVSRCYGIGSFTEIYESLKNADVRPWLSGDRNISNILKVVVALICIYKRDSINLSAVIRAMFYLEAYQHVKRSFKDADMPDARQNALKKTLGINFSAHATPLRPLFEQEPDNLQHYDGVDMGALVIPEAVPRNRPFIGLWAYLNERDHIDTVDDIQTFGLSTHNIRAVAAVQSLVCATESERIDTTNRVSLLPDPISEAAAKQYIQTVVRRLYENDYQTRLKSKRNQESQITMERQIEELIAAPDYATFRKLLISSVIVNRDHKSLFNSE
jgi:hypothetical protein